ncbi:Angiogenic factor with G patch and FHA domains 1 [Cyphomyrmex costatus]|uniref:Angiogenic factor with G patch and FHA domains 1 n=1 Tax=Cyphomyrmex costatus TaxID=456900 RepID=A0A195C2C3_9HYME|nr:Angiogenic factor with G patch and FHA domains 1 [Cyphomyrmex costatus]
MQSESEEGEIISDFEEDFTEELHSLPHVIMFICKLRDHIRKQRKKIDKLRRKLKEQKQQNLLCTKAYIDCGTQTNPLDFNKSLSQDWDVSHNIKSSSIVDQVKQVAESVLLQTGFVYEQTSGMYYDYSTGYYYDTKQGLYYDGNTGIYYYYDETSNTYQFHSQIYTDKIAPTNFQRKEETGKTYKVMCLKTHLISIPSFMRKYFKFYFKLQVLNEIDELIKDISNITIKRYKQHDDVKKRKFICDEENSEDKVLEEGECSGNENDGISDEVIPDVSINSESDDEEQDLAKNYPPCMRIIVKETDLIKLKLGSLFLVTCIGGTLGREGDHSVLIPDINISKYHARFVYDETKKQYQVIDFGSRNGTFINGKRLSVAKQESEPHEIMHGSIIQIGETKLLCHIHNGNETCGYCEPGLIQQNFNLDENKTSKTKLHKEELRRLKHKFGIEKNNVSSSQLALGYQDRAQARRQHVGSSDPYAKTQQSSIHTSITKDNKGFKLLSKMGWSEGRSLGKDGDGRTEPLPITCNHNKVGLGSKRMDIPNIELNSNMEKKQAVWRKTQQRYKEILD